MSGCEKTDDNSGHPIQVKLRLKLDISFYYKRISTSYKLGKQELNRRGYVEF